MIAPAPFFHDRSRIIRIVCLSDTHVRHDRIEVPDGDLLLHAGDLTNVGDLADVAAFDDFLGQLPHRHKVVIAGNHDFCFERSPEQARRLITRAHYLEDTSIEIEGRLIYGSPWQPWFGDWAFNLPRGPALAEKWARIPEATDIVVTHGPPLGHGDTTVRGEAVGCEDLRARLLEVKPRLHVFGHIHEGYGESRLGETICLNASICDVEYEPVNAPLVVDLD